jgi:hypothetical protein
MNRADTSLRTEEAMNIEVTWNDPAATRMRRDSSRPT